MTRTSIDRHSRTVPLSCQHKVRWKQLRFQIWPNSFRYLLSPLPTRITNLSTISVGPGFDLGGLDAMATRQVAREDHSTAKAKASSSKHTQRRKPTIPSSAPSTPLLIAPLGNGTRSVPSLNEKPQGPLQVDYELKLEVNFSSKMVLEMQEGVVCKTQRMVIGRVLGGKPTIKALQDCLKLHFTHSQLLEKLKCESK